MVRSHHWSMTGAVIVCLISTQGTGTLFASEDDGSLSGAHALTVATPEAQMATSEGSAAALSLDVHAAGIDATSGPVPQMDSSRLTLHAGIFATNLSLGPVAQDTHRTFRLAPTQSNAFAAGQVYQGRPYRMRRDGSVAALMIGAVATITGAAILVYAHRPECETQQFAGGCGYGTRVIGGAVLSGGIAGLFVGALTWR